MTNEVEYKHRLGNRLYKTREGFEHDLKAEITVDDADFADVCGGFDCSSQRFIVDDADLEAAIREVKRRRS